MNRPDCLKEYKNRDLKLGIKSSLPHVKATIALAILLWETDGRKDELSYSIEENGKIIIKKDLFDKFYSFCEPLMTSNNIEIETAYRKVNDNQLFKSQLESLIVAFELVWRIAEVSYVDKNKPNSAERTGGKRFAKKLTFSSNMDIIHCLIDSGKSHYIQVLLKWMGFNTQSIINDSYEKTLLLLLTALSESAVYKMDDSGRELIFNQEGVYRKALETGESVDIDGDKESKGTLRILKSMLSDGMNPYLTYSHNVVEVQNYDRELLACYQKRVDTFLRLSQTKNSMVLSSTEPTTMDVSSDNTQVNCSAEEQKEKFKRWMHTIRKDNGDPYSEFTIYSYVNQMENAYKTFEPYQSKSSIFEIQDAESLKEYTDYLYRADGFEEFNANAGNKACSCGLEKYRLFLNSNRQINYQTGFVYHKAHNRILFGAPGTGKSFSLNKDAMELLKNGGEYERVTFHPDYSYASFVGTYKPVPYKDDDGKDSITYRFVPGPFLRVLVKALKSGGTTKEPCLLLIEEINRANVAAVFGDVFQLLDRDEYGVSEYPIQTSEDVRKYLSEELAELSGDFSTLRIPDNMFVWATMNSADQGVFPMDTAFKRRWEFKYIGINDNDSDLNEKYVTLGSDEFRKRVEWNSLRKAINDFLAEHKINEDKQLGPYFISRSIVVPENGDIDEKRFAAVFKNKVIMYLFEDAAKQCHAKLFEGCEGRTLRYSEICKEFDKKGIYIFNTSISSQVKESTQDGFESVAGDS